MRAGPPCGGGHRRSKTKRKSWNTKMIKEFAKVIRWVCAHAGKQSRCDPSPSGRYGIPSANSCGTVAIVGFAALLSFGCIASSRTGSVPPDSQAQGYDRQTPQQPQGGLIKPYIPAKPGASGVSRAEGTPQQGDVRSPLPSHTGGSTGSSGAPERAGSAAPAPQGTSEVRTQWESQKVKAAAIKKAKTIPTVIKIKVWYAADSDEWWVTLYDDRGTLIDLKQFTWNREKLELEPYLVLKQIPRSQLEQHLTRQIPGRAFEILDYPATRQLL